jgi:hypothetical protein
VKENYKIELLSASTIVKQEALQQIEALVVFLCSYGSKLIVLFPHRLLALGKKI